jgi:PAT family beta-lactamase induction signal transducer AmpG
MAALAVVIAFCSASQDIVFDAWKTDVLPRKSAAPARQSACWAIAWGCWSPAGWRCGWPTAGSAGRDVLADGRAADPCIIATLLAPEPSDVIPVPKSLEQAVAEPLRDFFGRNNAWLILLLIVLYKLGDAFAMSLTTTFLIRGVGFDAGEVGMVNKTLGLFATIVGALYGGVLMQRLTLFRALLIFGMLQGVSNAGYWLLSITDKHLISMATAVFFENLCGGMGTAAFVALLMTLCNKSFSATQFALLSALSAVGRVYVGPIAGWFVEAHGWPTFYLFSVVAAVPGILLLLVCRQTLEHTQRTESFMPRTRISQTYALALIILAGCLMLAYGCCCWRSTRWITPTSPSLPACWRSPLTAVAGILLGVCSTIWRCVKPS